MITIMNGIIIPLIFSTSLDSYVRSWLKSPNKPLDFYLLPRSAHFHQIGEGG